MTTKQIMDRIVDFIQDLTAFHAELANELPNLRIVVDNTRAYSDVKKTPTGKFCFSRGRLWRLKTRKKTQA